MDISSILIGLLSQYPGTASAVTLVGVFGYVLTHVFPMLPKPAQPASGFYPVVYAILSFLAGNWGNAQNIPPSQQAMAAPPPPAVKAAP